MFLRRCDAKVYTIGLKIWSMCLLKSIWIGHNNSTDHTQCYKNFTQHIQCDRNAFFCNPTPGSPLLAFQNLLLIASGHNSAWLYVYEFVICVSSKFYRDLQDVWIRLTLLQIVNSWVAQGTIFCVYLMLNIRSERVKNFIFRSRTNNIDKR